MPFLDEIDGIFIVMNYFDTGKHNEPHVHVEYNEFDASISFDGEILAGRLPGKQRKTVIEWIKKNKTELQKRWKKAVLGLPIEKF